MKKEVKELLEKVKPLSDEEFDAMFPDFDKVVDEIIDVRSLTQHCKMSVKDAVDIVMKGGNVEDPKALGWGHFTGEYFEIQSLDVSNRFAGLKGVELYDAAIAAHRRECGCPWPEIDYQLSFMRWLEDAEKDQGKHWKLVQKLKGVAGDREKWPQNLARITALTTELLAASTVKDVDTGVGHPGLFMAASGMIKLLNRLDEDVKSGHAQLSLVFTDGDDWTECEKCGRGYYTKQDSGIWSFIHGPNCLNKPIERVDQK